LGAAALAAADLGLASVLAAGLLAASFTGPEGPVGETISHKITRYDRDDLNVRRVAID
jgi:hypothetical protein